MVSGNPRPLIYKIVAMTILLAALAVIVLLFPFLWELAVAGALGGVYWIFFRVTPDGS